MKQEPKDPFFGLKYLALIRTGLPSNTEDLDSEAFVTFAKWQICKVRNKLWNDPIWESYTEQEILIEFFAIKFDENDQLRKDFENLVKEPSKSDFNWFEQMEKKYAAGGSDKIKESLSKIKEEALTSDGFEDTF